MPAFRTRFTREVVETEEWFETIDADTAEKAQQSADDRASAMDMHCPDGVRVLHGAEIERWEVASMHRGASHPDEAAERVQPADAAMARAILQPWIDTLRATVDADTVAVPGVRLAVADAIVRLEAALAESDDATEASDGKGA